MYELVIKTTMQSVVSSAQIQGQEHQQQQSSSDPPVASSKGGPSEAKTNTNNLGSSAAATAAQKMQQSTGVGGVNAQEHLPSGALIVGNNDKFTKAAMNLPPGTLTEEEKRVKP